MMLALPAGGSPVNTGAHERGRAAVAQAGAAEPGGAISGAPMCCHSGTSQTWTLYYSSQPMGERGSTLECTPFPNRKLSI